MKTSRVALITGSATGVGAATALRLAQQGWRIVVNYARSEAEARATRAACEAAGAETLLQQADVADDGACRALVQATVERWGRIDALVNNAARVQRSTLETTDARTFDEVMAVNARAPLLLIRAALDALTAARGAVLNVGSVNAWAGEPTFVAYSASKGALMTLTRNLGDTLHRERGIRVNQINPEWVITERFLEAGAEVVVTARNEPSRSERALTQESTTRLKVEPCVVRAE